MLDDPAHVLLIVGDSRFQKKPGHSDNTIHRSADLVAHARKESAFSLRGLKRLIPGEGETLLEFDPGRDVEHEHQDASDSSIVVVPWSGLPLETTHGAVGQFNPIGVAVFHFSLQALSK
ncbi:MAG: hypothetical protein BWY82_00044 [Verrucomicrobia bacterium ADurb.Bin474]|nr:MAG: hypothetical protein BWY82_00044 [Verrucomicrobia bacterium ADurb.Bin474]